jgi:hypothetical protein
MRLRSRLGNWIAAIGGVALLALYVSMQASDGVFHPLVFVFAILVVSGFLLVGLVLWGAWKLLIGARRGLQTDAEQEEEVTADGMRFSSALGWVTLVVLIGWVIPWLVDGGQVADDKLPGILAVVGLVLALGAWFTWLTRDAGPDEVPTMIVVDPGGPGREPVFRPAHRSYASLLPPWFLLPIILVFGSLAVATGNVVLLLVPVAVAVGLVVLIAIGAFWFLHTHD